MLTEIPAKKIEKLGWLDVSIRAGVFTLGRWWGIDGRMHWREKVIVQNCGRATAKPKNQLDGLWWPLNG